MCALVVAWGLDYTVAKNALETMFPLNLLFCKYIVAFVFVLAVRLKYEKGPLFQKKDIGLFIVCAIFGDVLYFFSEYTAMSYIPISLISIVLAFVPIVSIAIEALIFKRRTSGKIIVLALVCICGVALIIGIDWHELFQGRIFGYLLAFTCVISWNIYNFITASLHERYKTVSLTLNQIICTCLLLLPYMIAVPPPFEGFTPGLIGGVVYLGLVSAGIGFIIIVRSLHVLGPTTTALFSNFLPVTATFFGWLFLGETIAPIQCVGGVIVIVAGYFVIKEKGRGQGNV